MQKAILGEIWRAVVMWVWRYFFPSKTVNIVPSLPTDPITGGLDIAAEALALGMTVETYLLSPQYQAALLAAKKKQDIDRIRETEQKAEQGDADALNQMRKDVS